MTPLTRWVACSLPVALLWAMLGACSQSDAMTSPPVASSGAQMWGADFFPNIPLVTQRGEHVRFFDDLIKDKVVAVNFIYTQCADACPMETARMVEVAKLLGDRLGKDVFFYSISIDPAHDTPAVLAAYAKAWHTGPGWTFLTGNDDDVTALRKKLGVYDADRKKKDHNLSLVIGNQRTGRWMKRSPAENPYVLADQLGSWLHNWKLPHAKRDYAEAPEVRNISTGEELFRARCATCHTVGGGDRNDVETRRVGPDLKHVVAQRDRAWLERWIAEPDKMLAEKDPLATALFAQYQNIPMPNLRMSHEDIAQVLQYLGDESAGKTEAPRVKHVVSAADAAVVRAALATYDELRRALARDDLDAVHAAARQLRYDGADRLAAAGDLDAARAAFAALSQALIGVLVDNPALQQGRWLFQCPHASGYGKWIQADAALTNPYMGLKMPGCGSQLGHWKV